MSKLSVDLQKYAGIVEGDAEKVLAFLTKGEVKVTATAPKAIAGLAVILAAVDRALGDATAAAANPTTLVLNLGTDAADLKAVWSDVKSFIDSLGIKL
jgi:hypothetical protein